MLVLFLLVVVTVVVVVSSVSLVTSPLPPPPPLSHPFLLHESHRIHWFRLFRAVPSGSGGNPGEVPIPCLLSLVQHRARIRGSVGEIGVFLGRFFLAMAMCAERGEDFLVVDIFDRHELASDASGLHGGTEKRQRFLQNVAAFGISPSQLTIHQLASTSLNTLGPNVKVRMFSIDGGHTRDITKHDMSLVCAHLMQGGILMIDDYSNPAWPGVRDGVDSFFRDSAVLLAPFLLAWGKLYLTHSSHHELFLDAIQNYANSTPTSTWQHLHGYNIIHIANNVHFEVSKITSALQKGLMLV